MNEHGTTWNKGARNWDGISELELGYEMYIVNHEEGFPERLTCRQVKVSKQLVTLFMPCFL